MQWLQVAPGMVGLGSVVPHLMHWVSVSLRGRFMVGSLVALVALRYHCHNGVAMFMAIVPPREGFQNRRL